MQKEKNADYYVNNKGFGVKTREVRLCTDIDQAATIYRLTYTPFSVSSGESVSAAYLSSFLLCI